MVLGILHIVPDFDEAYGNVARLLDAVPSAVSWSPRTPPWIPRSPARPK
nr:hypothetical protein [Streptomyces sp. CNQ-509]